MAAARAACFLSRNRTITKLLQNPIPYRHAPPPPHLPSFHHQTPSSPFSTFANHKFFQNPNTFSFSSLINPTSTILNPNLTILTIRSFSAKAPSSGASDKKSGPKHPSKKKNNKSSSKKASAVNLRRTKIRFLKQRRGSITGVTHQGNTVAFGKYGLQALEAARITSRQIEAGRKSMTRYAHRGRGGKIWIRMIADKSVTAKPVEVRMGRGKGAIKGMVSVVKPGKILYEISGIPENLAREAITLAGSKLPIKSKFVTAS